MADDSLNLVGLSGLGLLALLLVVGLATLVLVWRWAERSGPTLLGRAGERWAPLAEAPLVSWLRRRFPRLLRFLGHRLSPEGYLGLHLTLGLALLLAALWLFVALAGAFGDDGGLARIDRAVVGSLERGASPEAVAAFQVITHLGDVATLTGIGVVGGLLLLAARRWLLLITWAAGLAGGGLLNLALKDLFQRARPSLPNPFAVASGWSFPSGHAMGSFVTYIMLAYLVVRLAERRWRRPAVLLALAVALLIGLSRIYLGVHYVSDVIAGYAAGAAWVSVCVTGAEAARRWYHARRAPEPPRALERSQ